MDDLADLSAFEARALMRDGALRAADLAEACLARIAEREPEVGAFAWLDPDAVRAAAAACDEAPAAGPLNGIPVGLKDIIEKINAGWMDFDVAVSTTVAMKEVRAVARVLGPKGLMPNPKSGTVTDDIAAGIKAVKAGRVEFKVDKTANIGVGVGKRSFTPAQITENVAAVLEAVGKAKPAAFKGHYIKSVTLSSSMSPGVKLATAEFNKF